MTFRAWIIAVAFALIGCLGQAQEQAQSGGRQAEKEQSPSDNPTVAVPVYVVGDQSAADARKRAEEEARQREIEDLVAQQGMNAATQAMNDATQRMAKYAFWSTVLVGIGTILLFLTLWLTREANKSARDAVEITRRIGNTQLRAYVGPRDVFFDLQTQTISFRIRNFGQTPAYDVYVRTYYLGPNETPRRDPHHFGILDPGSHLPGQFVTQNLWQSGARKAAQVIVVISYSDIDGPHVRRHRFRLNPDTTLMDGRYGFGLVGGSSNERQCQKAKK